MAEMLRRLSATQEAIHADVRALRAEGLASPQERPQDRMRATFRIGESPGEISREDTGEEALNRVTVFGHLRKSTRSTCGPRADLPRGTLGSDFDLHQVEELPSGWMLQQDWPRSLEKRLFSTISGKLSFVATSHLSRVVTSQQLGTSNSYRSEAFMFNPHGPARITLDGVSLFVLLYDILSLPIFIAWNVRSSGTLLIINYATSVFWLADLIMNFMTGFHSNGMLVMDRPSVVKHYLKTWFTLDLLVLLMNFGSLVSDTFVEGGGDGNGAAFALLRAVKASRIMRITGVLRVLRVTTLLRRFAERNMSSSLMSLWDIPGLIIVLVLVNHFVGCCWWFIGQNAPSDSGRRWVTPSLVEASPVAQYLTSLHWSLTQMTPGSMSTQAENSVERAFTIIVLVCGVIFFSSIISRLSATLVGYRALRLDQQRKISRLSSMLRRLRIGPQLAAAAMISAKERLLAARSVDSSVEEVLSLLPERFRQTLHFEISLEQLNHPIFCWWGLANESEARNAFSKCIAFNLLARSDTLFTAAVTATHSYVVMSGCVRYHQEPCSAKVSASRTEDVPLHVLAAEAALFIKWSHVGTAEADKTSEVMAVGAESLGNVLATTGAPMQVFRSYGAVFHARVINSKEYPTDLRVHGTAIESMCLEFKKPVRTLLGLVAVQQARVQSPYMGLNFAPWGRWLPAQMLNKETVDKDGSLRLSGRASGRLTVGGLSPWDIFIESVESGDRCMVMDGSGRPAIVDYEGALKLRRVDNNDFLVQVGTLTPDNGIQAAVHLPRRKELSSVCECHGDELAFLVKELFGQFSDFCEIDEEPSAHQLRDATQSFGVPVRIATSVFEATLDEEYFKVKQLDCSIRSSDGFDTGSCYVDESNSPLYPEDIFVIARDPSLTKQEHRNSLSSDQSYKSSFESSAFWESSSNDLERSSTFGLYAWMTPKKFAELQAQESAFVEWLQTVVVDDETIANAHANMHQRRSGDFVRVAQC